MFHQPIPPPKKSLLKRLFPTLSRVNPDVTWLDWGALLLGIMLVLPPAGALARLASGGDVWIEDQAEIVHDKGTIACLHRIPFSRWRYECMPADGIDH